MKFFSPICAIRNCAIRYVRSAKTPTRCPDLCEPDQCGDATRPPGMTSAMHLCRGNFTSAWVAEGGYDPVAEMLFNDINIDGYFLASIVRRAGNLRRFVSSPRGERSCSV